MTNSNVSEFIDRAKANGASEQTLVGILTTRGWPDKEAYEALAAHYERTTGMQVPKRTGAGTAAKDAFFYLLIFSTWSMPATTTESSEVTLNGLEEILPRKPHFVC